jgi:putative transposase
MRKRSVCPEHECTRTLRVRVRDSHVPWLRARARDVNFVWNYDQEVSLKVLDREGRFLSAEDLHAFTAGVSKAGLELHSHTVQAVNEEYVLRRARARKRRLRWRVSDRRRSNYSLGWIPFKAVAIQCRSKGIVRIMGRHLCLWDSYDLSQYKIRTGCFSEDARGRWHLNVVVRVKRAAKPAHASTQDIGIDLGLKYLLATSDGIKVKARRFYRDFEARLAVAQRAGKRDRVRALHAKIRNRRSDHLHKLSSAMVSRHGAIFVGNVNASALAQTRQAKSVLDAGWRAFRNMLRYKCHRARVVFLGVDEAGSTQTCSACGARCGPKGIAGLGIREWLCGECGTVHDRDVNAARNILAAGRRRLAEGIPALAA